MNIFVTGASGFVGCHLLPQLIAKGYPVTALVRSRQEAQSIPAKARVVIADLSKKGPWQKQLKGHDLLIHLAAQISAKDASLFKKNTTVATKNLVKAAKAARVKKIILFSSAAVTSIRQDAYAASKKQQEAIIKSSKIAYHILRPSMIYGPGDTKNIGWLISLVKKMPIVPLPGGGKFGRQPVYVADICKIVLKLIEKKYRKSIFEIHGFEYVTLERMIRLIIKESKAIRFVLPVPLFSLTVTFWLAQRILRNPKFTTDQIKSLTSAERFVGDDWAKTFDIIPTTFEAGLARMISEK